MTRLTSISIVFIGYLLICTSAVFAFQSLESESLNEVQLLDDPSFESATTGLPDQWRTPQPDFVGLSSGRSNDALHGANSIRFEPATGSRWMTRVVDQLTPGKRYLYSANVMIRGNEGEAVFIVRDLATRSFLAVNQVRPGACSTWQKLVVDFVAQSDKVLLTCRVTDNEEAAFLDLIRVQEADSVLGTGSFESDAEQWRLTRNASINENENDSFLGQRSLLVSNDINTRFSFASRTIFLGPDDHLKAFKLSAAIKTTPTVDAQATDLLLNSVSWLVEPFMGFMGDMFQCNIESDWLDNPLDDIEIADRNVPELRGEGAGFRIRVFSADGARFRDIAAPLFYSKSGVFHEREFHFLVPQWARVMIVNAVNKKSSLDAFFDNVRLSAKAMPEDEFTSELGPSYNPVEAPLPGSFLAPADFEEIQSAVNQVSDPLNANFGKIVWVDAGLYSGPQISVWSNLHLKMHPSARMSRSVDPNIPFGFAAGFFRSCNNRFPGTTPLRDIVIEGGQYVSNQRTGNAIALAANRVVVRNMLIPTWSRPGATNPAQFQISGMYLFGNDLSVHNNLVSGPTNPNEDDFVFLGYDGIHIWGGTGASIFNNFVRAGDDGVGLFPITQFMVQNAVGPDFPIHHYDYTISDIEIYNNRLNSHGARTIGLGLPVPRQRDRRLNSEVTDVRARNFVGKCGGGAALLTIACRPAPADSDLPPDGIPDSQVANILIEDAVAFGDFSIESQASFHGRVKEFGLEISSSDVGSFRDIQIRNVFLKNVTTAGLAIAKETIDGIANQEIDIRGCNFNASNDEEPQLPHRRFTIDQLGPGEVNSDIESANIFQGAPGIFNFR